VALFSRGDRESKDPSVTQTRPVLGREAFCRICGSRQQFTRCWLRVGYVAPCPSCGAVFNDPAALYKKTLPECPRCGEYLEQPGFEYGLCDGCGSKFEVVAGSKPSLLPNKQQRAEMEKLGHAWRKD